MGPERIPHPFAHAYSFFNLEAARMGKFGLANKLGVYGALTDNLGELGGFSAVSEMTTSDVSLVVISLIIRGGVSGGATNSKASLHPYFSFACSAISEAFSKVHKPTLVATFASQSSILPIAPNTDFDRMILSSAFLRSKRGSFVLSVIVLLLAGPSEL
jgi:hypothetical protein